MRETGKVFYQICVILSMVMPLTVSVTQNSCNCSTYDRSYQKILSRQKRFMIFSKNSNVLHTSYFGKQIVARFPTGFNWILELDMFYPLPFEPRVFTQAKDLFNNPKVKSDIPPWLMQPKKPMPPMQEIISYDEHIPEADWTSDSKDIFVPPSGWKDDVLANIKNQEMQMKQRSWRVSPNNWTNNNMLYDKSQYYRPRGRSLGENDIRGNDIDPDPRWENIYAQKDRQELYEIIHAGFKKIGIDTTACLQRTICEVKHFLLPKGKSLLHDVFRVLFTYPIHLNDQWAKAGRAKDQTDCRKTYSNECPMSILDFMLHSGNVF